MEAQIVGKEKFRELLRNKLGSSYDRAESVYDNFGAILSYDVVNVLLHAADQGKEKVEEVLVMLEKHYQEHLMFQHPDIRGTVHNSLGINETQVTFLNICQKVLNLQPVQPA